ncbi:polysaccharide deacetylase family protein [Arthrobacter sp. MYb227]|uniref:polysaccharide deacetylase family protein n=1 Tax=Arthrobacter sp. MYb227 TaxID=1848601 RepID=UPI0015E29D86|nr:polysaccharide deacetylase family protein [Arthrobacter sp. MYb227]
MALSLITGCAPIAGSPTTPLDISSSEGVLPTPENEQYKDSLPLSLIPDLHSVDQSDEDHHIFTRHFEVASLSSVGEAQRALIESKRVEFDRNNIQDVSAGSGISGELNIRSYLSAVSTHIIGIKTITYEFAGASGGNSFITQWFDTSNNTMHSSRDLFAGEEQWDDFREYVALAATKNPEVIAEDLVNMSNELLDSVNFDAQGNATIDFDDYSIAPGSAGSLTVTVPSQNVVPLLSPLGVLARNAAMSPAPRSLISSVAPLLETLQSTESPASVSPPLPAKTERVDCSKAKCVALTFDDGPGPKTGKLLDDLKKANAPATFFVVGPNAKNRPEILKRMIAEGHEVGNHTWNHRSLPSLNSAKIRSEIDRTNEAIAAAIGEPASLLRPPYGAHDSITDRLAQAPVILWDVDTLDWKYRNADKVVAETISQTRPGSIVLMHDIHASTVAAVPRILSQLKAKGYTFVTVSELLGKENLKSGETYSRAPSTGKGSAKNGGKK